MKNHLKRIATPRTWLIDRKSMKFIVRPNAGGHAFDAGLPLGVILRDVLQVAATIGEVKKILNNNDVLVDGKRRKDHRFIVGLFDVIAIPTLKQYYRVVLDKKARLTVHTITEDESTIKPCKVVGKTALPKGKIQANLHDGKNIILTKDAKVGDTLLLSLPSLEVKEVFPLASGNTVFLTKGKHGGDMGTLKEIKGEEAIYSAHNQEIETAKEYLFVLGTKKAAITINGE